MGDWALNSDQERRISDVENAIDDLRKQIKPLVDTYNAASLGGSVLKIIGGFLVGAAVIWVAISGWVTSHWKPSGN